MAVSSLVPEIVHEEENFFIVNKPCGYYSHPNHPTHQVKSLVGYYADKMVFPDNTPRDSGDSDDSESWMKSGEAHADSETPDTLEALRFSKVRKGLVHRLDRETSGLVIMAKNPHALKSLQDLFRDRLVVKNYRALVHGHFFQHQRRFIHKLIRDPRNRTRRKVWVEDSRPERPDQDVDSKNYKVAETEVSPIAFFKQHTLLEVRIFTGRTHQIRVQLSYEGYPLVGDKVYGSPRRGEPSLLMLCAYGLEFPNPFTGKTFALEIPLHDYFAGYMGRLEGYHLQAKANT